MAHSEVPHDEMMETEDPLAGDVDPMGYDDETEYVDVRDLEVNEDEDGYTVDGHGNRLHEDEVPLRPETGETHNKLVLLLEETIRDRAAERGLTEEEAKRISRATFILKDAEGNPADKLDVSVSHYEGMYSRSGVDGFYLAPIDGEKDAWDRDQKFVRGNFAFTHSPEHADSESPYSMHFGGGSNETLRNYVKSAINPDRLAQADLVELKTLDSTEEE